MTVWRVVSSWGNVLGVCVLLLVVLLFGKVGSEYVSLLIESTGELSGSFLKGLIEGFVVVLNDVVKCMFSINFSLSESVSQLLADCIEFGPLDFTEGLERSDFLVKGVSESLSGLAEGFGDGCSLSFEKLDEVELVVGVVHEVDLLEFPGLCGIEGGLFLGEGAFEGGSLGADRLNEGVVVVVKSVLECGRISLQAAVESSSLRFDVYVKSISGLLLGINPSRLHLLDKVIHRGQNLFYGTLKLLLQLINDCVLVFYALSL